MDLNKATFKMDLRDYTKTFDLPCPLSLFKWQFITRSCTFFSLPLFFLLFFPSLCWIVGFNDGENQKQVKRFNPFFYVGCPMFRGARNFAFHPYYQTRNQLRLDMCHIINIFILWINQLQEKYVGKALIYLLFNLKLRALYFLNFKNL